MKQKKSGRAAKKHKSDKVSAPSRLKGRPKKKFTEEQIWRIEQMAFDQCHTRTIAEALCLSQDTIKRHFASFLTQKRAEGRAALRRMQMAMSRNNVTMQIWLGKQYLDQVDKNEQTHGITDALADLIREVSSGSNGLPINEG